MAKKEEWMKKGNAVIALGKPGVIVKLLENEGLVEVFQADVKLNGNKHTGRYHISDLSEIKIVQA